VDFFATACALQPVGSLVSLTQNDKILVILGYFSFYHTNKPCHTERSEVSINLKYGFFATLKMTKRRGKAKANAFCPNSPTNFSKFS